MLTYALVHCGLIAAEVEAEYMWGLLHPSLLSGEGGYYLTTLSSAVHVLKHLQRCHADVVSKTFTNGQGHKVCYVNHFGPFSLFFLLMVVSITK